MCQRGRVSFAVTHGVRTKEENWAQNLHRLYGITPSSFERRLRGQKGLCAICTLPPPGGQRLHVDHDHKTGKIRGLLCHGCNTFLGKLEKRLSRLPAILAYLNPNKKNRSQGSVYQLKKSGRWHAQAMILGRHQQIGTFGTEEEARSALKDYVPEPPLPPLPPKPRGRPRMERSRMASRIAVL